MSHTDPSAAIRGGRFADALASLELLPKYSLSQRVVRSQLLHHCGHLDDAFRIATHVIAGATADPTLLALAYEVRGAVHFDRGRLKDATNEYALARTLGEANTPLLARLELRQSQIDHPPTYSDHLLRAQRLRRLVTSAGDPHLLVLMHLRFAQWDARTGNIDNAIRHLELADQLLCGSPNEWLSGMISLDRGAIAHMQGDTSGALDNAQRALDHAATSGHLRTQAAALTNLCGFCVELGDLSLADHYFDRAYSIARAYTAVFMGLLDNGARLRSAHGDVDGAKHLLGHIEAWLHGHDDSEWSRERIELSITQARLLSTLSQYEQVTRTLDTAISTAERIGYQSRKAELLAAQSIAWCELGAHARAREVLTQAIRHSSRQPPARRAVDYATAILEHRTGSERRAAELGARVRRRRGTIRTLAGPDIPKTPLQQLDWHTAEVLAVLLDLIDSPRLLADELVNIVDRLDAPVSARSRLASQNAMTCGPTSHTSEKITIDLGAVGNEQLLLDLQCDRDHFRATALMYALGRFVESMVALRNYQAKERGSLSLWPISEVGLRGSSTVVTSAEMRAVIDQIRLVAAHNVTVLLTGETGTGKEVMARELHRLSSRSDGPFVPFNCSAVPREMLDSQLFGHRRGAFTGADSDFRGVVRTAEAGTLFLDEIGELSYELQPKLLRFLESGEVLPLGEARPVTVSVRVVSATNADLEGLVSSGRFREDLYYRLNVVPFRLPPLRSRREEIPELVALYLARFAAEMDKGNLAIADEALESLILYHWPGNIRQLMNEVRRLVALSPPNTTIPLSLLSPAIARRCAPVHGAGKEDAHAELLAKSDAEQVSVKLDRPLADAVTELERTAIARALARHDGHLERAARDLGLSRKGLFLKRQRLGLM